MKLKTALFSIVSATFLLAGSTAFAGITVNLTFDTESLANGTTGTFSISGSATSDNGAAAGWMTTSFGSANLANSLGGNNYFTLNVVSVDTTPLMSYNSTPFTSYMTGQSFMEFYAGSYGSSRLLIRGSQTYEPVGAIFEIGNGTTDYISGTFTVDSSSLGAFSTEGLSGSFGSNGAGTNVNLIVTAVPEPSAYAALAGLTVLGLAAVRRRRVGQSLATREK